MSLLTQILGWFGLYRDKKPDNFFDQQKDKFWYWRKNILLVGIPEGSPLELLQAYNQWKEASPANAPRLFLAAKQEEADIVIAMEDAVTRGGVTTRVPSKTDPREIAWVKISIAKGERGRRLLSICLHELWHGLGGTHDGAPKGDVAHPDASATSISDAAKKTYRMMRENIPPIGG